MTLDYQILINAYVQLTLFAFPLATVMLICEKLIGIVQRFIFGKEIKL